MAMSLLKNIFEKLKQSFPSAELYYYQSNVEGEIINQLQKVGFDYHGIVLNAGALHAIPPLQFTMPSRPSKTPVVEVQYQ